MKTYFKPQLQSAKCREDFDFFIITQPANLFWNKSLNYFCELEFDVIDKM